MGLRVEAQPGSESGPAAAAALPHRRLTAVLYGGVTHSLFAVAVGVMMVQLYSGMSLPLDPHLGSQSRFWVDLLLVLQFPLLHSWLLAGRGKRWLLRLAPKAIAADLTTTTFAAVASLQILLAFGLWVPSGIVWWQPRGPALVAHTAVYALAWLFLIKALWDARLALQVGALGWQAVYRGQKPVYGRFPERGLFRYLRQPVYFGFMLTLWTGPVWTPDHLTIALVWTLYCVVGPRLKERRYRRLYGHEFDAYRAQVPYLLPSLPRWRKDSLEGN